MYVLVCCIVLTSTAFFVQLSAATGTLGPNDDIQCQALPQIVPVGENGLPHFVELFQCQGSVPNHHPKTKNCTYKTYHIVTVKGTNNIVKTFKNHTRCKEQCATPCPSSLDVRNETTCACTCPHKNPPSGHECPEGKIWDSENCECICNLDEFNPPHHKTLDKKQCKFVCQECRPGRVSDPKTCRCRPPIPPHAPVANDCDKDSSQQGTILVALVIGEFVFLYLIFDMFLYWKHTGLMYFIRRKCCGKPCERPAQPEAQALNNVPCEVIVDSNGRSHIPPEPGQQASSTSGK